MKKLIFLTTAIICLIGCPINLFGSEVSENILTLEEYMGQIGGTNGTYLGAIENREGSIELKREADLIFSPSFFANAEVEHDEQQPYGLFYDNVESQNYSSGLTQKTPYGLQTKIYYEFDHTAYSYFNQTDKYYDASPVIELSLPLWKNGFGRSDRANEEATRAQAEANAWSAESQRKTLLVNAEVAYWQLAITREIVEIQKRGLTESQTIYEYVEKRAQMNLTDQSDVLQAKADLETKKLDLKSAQDDEGIALRNFNAYRNASIDDGAVILSEIDWDKVSNIPAPDKFTSRADVRAAEAQARASEANSRIKEEDNKPSLDLYADYAMNGNSTEYSDAFSDSFSMSKPTIIAGIKFSVPLNFSASSDSRKGARRQEYAAKLIYQQKLRGSSDWVDDV